MAYTLDTITTTFYSEVHLGQTDAEEVLYLRLLRIDKGESAVE
jgi:hypothetical protein